MTHNLLKFELQLLKIEQNWVYFLLFSLYCNELEGPFVYKETRINEECHTYLLIKNIRDTDLWL